MSGPDQTDFVQFKDFTDLEQLSQFVVWLGRSRFISIETTKESYRVWYFNT